MKRKKLSVVWDHTDFPETICKIWREAGRDVPAGCMFDGVNLDMKSLRKKYEFPVYAERLSIHRIGRNLYWKMF